MIASSTKRVTPPDRRHPSGWSGAVAKIGLFTAVALVTLTSCADPEASDQPISRGSSSPSAKASTSWVAEKFALTDCPVPDEAFCGVAVVAVNAIASGDAAALVELSRPDAYDCDVVMYEFFPGCVTTDVVLDGYAFTSGTFPKLTTEVLSEKDYLHRLEAMFASVDPSYSDEHGSGATRVVGVKKCGGDWTITWTAAMSQGGAPSQRMAGFFGFVVEELGSDEWFTPGPWVIPLAYPEGEPFPPQGDPPLDEIGCGEPTLPWPSP